MRSMFVVALSRLLDHHACFGQARKDLRVQALLSERAVEAFVAAVLPGTTGIDRSKLDAVLVHLGFQNDCVQFASVIAANRSWATIQLNQASQQLSGPDSDYLAVYLDREEVAGRFVPHGKQRSSCSS